MPIVLGRGSGQFASTKTAISAAAVVGYLCMAACFSVPSVAQAALLYHTPGPPIQDLDIGSDGDVFAVSIDTSAGQDGTLLQWIHGDWVPFGTRRGTRVAVDGRGRPWLINQAQEVWRFDGQTWIEIAGTTARAIDIGRTASGVDRIFIIRPSYLVAHWNGSSFVNFSGSGTEITVDNAGNPWIVNWLDEIWQYRSGSGWRYLAGSTARDIDAGADGTVYMLQGGSGSDGIIYRYNPGSDDWDYNGGYGVRITVAPTGSPAIVNSSRSVWGGFVKRIHGDALCQSNEVDCNVCAFDVRGQFAAMFADGRRTDTGDGWRLHWDNSYSPSSRTPDEAFDYCCPVISDHHVQGFVRTGHPLYPFAGSYSDNTTGSIFLVSSAYSSAPHYGLSRIASAAMGEKHPSGVHALGRYLGASENDQLRVYSISNISQPPTVYTMPSGNQVVSFPGTDPTKYFGSAGGGLGMARLLPAQGQARYLVAATNPGNNDTWPPRHTFFWELSGDSPTDATEVAFLGGAVHQLPDSWGWNTFENENLSLITECETGQIYGIHTSGDWSQSGWGFWRVSRLEYGPNAPRFRALDSYYEGQNEGDCHLRSSATAYADSAGVISTYCHQRDVRRWNGEATDTADFRIRRGEYSNSCVGACGTARASCFCDSACTSFGDCCSDYSRHCSSNPT